MITVLIWKRACIPVCDFPTNIRLNSQVVLWCFCNTKRNRKIQKVKTKHRLTIHIPSTKQRPEIRVYITNTQVIETDNNRFVEMLTSVIKRWLFSAYQHLPVHIILTRYVELLKKNQELLCHH
jgi:hypothetical protein